VTTHLSAALWSEALKFRRSRVPWVTAAVLALTPLLAGLFVLAVRDPQTSGLVGGKTQMLGATADWDGYFTLLTQIDAVGGLLALGVVTAWVFGREFSDRMAVDLLALPTPRAAIVTAKFLLIVAWSAAVTALVPLVALVVGGALGLPGWSTGLLWETVGHLAVLSGLNTLLVTPVALAASIGRGYLPAIGLVLIVIALAQAMAAIGAGAWFPWSVPALASGMAGAAGGAISATSYLLVGLTVLAGAVLTMTWWRLADQR
jgi:ABC-2 type transport system permease protein